MTSESLSAHRRSRIGRTVAWVLGIILLLAVACTAWIGIRGFFAYQHLDSARSAASDAPAVLADPTKATDLIDQISADTSAAHALTDDVIWKIGEQLPWMGPQLEAISTLASSLDTIASKGLAPLATVATTFSLDSIRPQEGVIDVSPLAEIAPAAAASAEALQAAREEIATVTTAPLVEPVRKAVDQVSALVTETNATVDALHRASSLLPLMLGTDGPRDYLIVFQNNAEWRSLGGIVGAMLQLHTEGGRMTLVNQGSSSDFPRYDDMIVPLSTEEQQLFGTQPARFVQNVTQIPDFTRGAPIAREMWLREKGVDVDGVIALDPVALSYLLAATGPVALPTGDTLSSDTAVDLLLNDVYLRYEEPAEQDAFFAAAAAAVFGALTSGNGSPSELLTAMARAGAEDRLLIWSRDTNEQAILDGTTLQGALPVTDSTTTAFGVYANDATSSKMDFYQTLNASTSWCGNDRAQLEITVLNNAPADAAELPIYINGGGLYGVPPGEVKTVTYVYLPLGSSLVSSVESGDKEPLGFGSGVDRGRDVIIWNTQLSSGQFATLTIEVETPRTQLLVTRMTPTTESKVTSTIAPECNIPR